MKHLLPTPIQTILLKACLLEKEEAIQYFNQWIDKVNIDLASATNMNMGLPQVYDSLDFGSQRLLGLLYYNLTKHGYTHPIIEKLRGYFKYVWVRNQVLMKEMHELNSEFGSKDIKIIFFKGMSIVDKYYPHPGTRPTIDLDVVINLNQINEIIEIYKSEGWKAKYPHEEIENFEKSLAHAVTVKKEEIEFDLHCQFSQYPLQDETTKLFWDKSRLNSKNLRFLSPAHELFCVLLHGFQWSPDLHIRWVPDSVMIMKTFEQNDWEEFSRLIETENYNSIVKLAFEYLTNEGLISIPENIKTMVNNAQFPSSDYQKIIRLRTSEKSAIAYSGVKLNYLISKAKHQTFLGSIKGTTTHFKVMWGAKNNLEFTGHIMNIVFDKILSARRK